MEDAAGGDGLPQAAAWAGSDAENHDPSSGSTLRKMFAEATQNIATHR